MYKNWININLTHPYYLEDALVAFDLVVPKTSLNELNNNHLSIRKTKNGWSIIKKITENEVAPKFLFPFKLTFFLKSCYRNVDGLFDQGDLLFRSTSENQVLIKSTIQNQPKYIARIELISEHFSEFEQVAELQFDRLEHTWNYYLVHKNQSDNFSIDDASGNVQFSIQSSQEITESNDVYFQQLSDCFPGAIVKKISSNQSLEITKNGKQGVQLTRNGIVLFENLETPSPQDRGNKLINTLNNYHQL